MVGDWRWRNRMGIWWVLRVGGKRCEENGKDGDLVCGKQRWECDKVLVQI